VVYILYESSFQGKKILVFDLDGTIVKLKVNWQELKSILNRRYSKIYNESCEFQSISECLSFIVAKDDNEELHNFFDIIKKFEIKKIENNIPIDQTIELIKNKEEFGIDKDAKLAILSLNSRNTIKNSLEQEDILKNFDFIVGREDVRRWKPEPEGLIIIKNHFKVENDEMLYIGDMKKDLITGKNAGIEAYLIDDLIEFVNKKKNSQKNHI